MTHVCRRWRDTLLSTPSLWTQLDFSLSSGTQQAESFLRLSRDQLLDVYQCIARPDHAETFLSTILRNISRVQRLDITALFTGLEHLLGNFESASAPEPRCLEITNHPHYARRDMSKYFKISGGRLPKLSILTLHHLHINLRDFKLSSLTRFDFKTGTSTSVQDLASFFARCPLLEFIRIYLDYTPEQPTAPPANEFASSP